MKNTALAFVSGIGGVTTFRLVKPPSCLACRTYWMEQGFVHVTGITVQRANRSSYLIGERLSQEELGQWDRKNGVTCFVTSGGEVWLSVLARLVNRNAAEEHHGIRAILGSSFRRLRGCFVPCANRQEEIIHSELVQRIANPYANILCACQNSMPASECPVCSTELCEDCEWRESPEKDYDHDPNEDCLGLDDDPWFDDEDEFDLGPGGLLGTDPMGYDDKLEFFDIEEEEVPPLDNE